MGRRRRDQEVECAVLVPSALTIPLAADRRVGLGHPAGDGESRDGTREAAVSTSQTVHGPLDRQPAPRAR
jgi:hypothetical protein